MEAEVHLIQIRQLLDPAHARVGKEEALQERETRDASPVSFGNQRYGSHSRIGHYGQRQAPYDGVVERRALIFGHRALDGDRVINEIRGCHCDKAQD